MGTTKMAPKKPTKEERIENLKKAGKTTQFQPGNKAACNRPKMSSALKELRGDAKHHALECIIKTMMMTQQELSMILMDPQTTNTQRLVASLLDRAIDEGCFMRAQFLFNYILGKPVPMEEQKDSNGNIIVFKSSVKPDGSIVQELLDSESGQEIMTEIENIGVGSGV